MITWLTLNDAAKRIGVDYADLWEAVRKGKLRVSYFGPKSGVAKTTDEEIDRWSRELLYSNKELRLLNNLVTSHNENEVRDRIKEMTKELRNKKSA